MGITRNLGLAALVATALFGAPALGQTQGKPPVQQEDAAKSAFLALPESDRKAIQDALGWLGLYNGTVDGNFGKRTLDAIVAFQKKRQLPADGIVDDGQLTALKLAATAARAAVGFGPVEDANTGVRISAPAKLTDRRDATPGRTVLSSRDRAVSLTLVGVLDPAVKLDALFKSESAETETRKVTYKAFKAGAFFVVGWEDGDAKAYERYQVDPEGKEAGKIRGFQFVYPKARAKALDPVALAVANSFEPFDRDASSPKPIPTPPTPIVEAPPKPLAPAAVAYLYGPGVALTALTAADCGHPQIQGVAATFDKNSGGLALLKGAFGADLPVAWLGAVGGSALALTPAPGASVDKPRWQAETTAALDLGDGRLSLQVATEEGARGSPVFDVAGGLVAVLADSPPSRRVGGQAIAEPHPAFGPRLLGALVEAGSPKGGAPGAADIVAANRARLVTVRCGA